MPTATQLAFIGLAGLSATLACVAIGMAPYPAAAVMAGTGVAAVGVNRRVTGDCWGSCGAHRMCDRDSGLCVPQPCGGECRYDEICQHERCVLRPTERPALSTDVDAGTNADDDSGPVQ
jgi:hypothetical protein